MGGYEYADYCGTYSSYWPVVGQDSTVCARSDYVVPQVHTTVVYVRPDEEEKEEEPPLSIKHDYPRINFKVKTKKTNTKPEHVSINKEITFINFLTRAA